MRSRVTRALVVGSMLLAGCQSGGSTSVTSPIVVVSPSASPTTIVTATPSASPTAEPTVPTKWTTYTSTRYSYAIDAPNDWRASPAKRDWPASGDTYPDDDAVDRWTNPQNSPYWVLMFVLSVTMAPGETAADRMAKVDADNANYCQMKDQRAVTVDGVAGRREDGRCFGSDYIDQVALVNDGRFYFIYLLSATPFSKVTKATFEHFLGSFQLL
jgi:hypothetical protein